MGKARVALETAVVTHGLPYPYNLESAKRMAEAVKREDAIPEFIGIIDGNVKLGLKWEEIEKLSKEKNVMKVGVRELAYVVSKRISGGTTVSASVHVASISSTRVFSTGGLGGIHIGRTFDVSQDFLELSRHDIIVVCSGFKNVIDLERSLEYLETIGVLYVTYKTDYIPYFYSSKSEFKSEFIANSPEEIADMYLHKITLGVNGAILVFNPIPEEFSIPYEEMKKLTEKAVKDMKEKGIKGKEVTPFLLKRISELTENKSIQANLALLENNANLAAKIAKALKKINLY